MVKNVIFVILFVLVFAAVIVFGSSGSDKLPTDSTGQGTFAKLGSSSLRYESEAYGVGLTFDKNWIIYDGARLEKMTLESNVTAEIENKHKCSIKDLAYVAGFVAPDSSLEITAVKNSSIPTRSFSSEYMDELVAGLKSSVDAMGAKWSGGSAYTDPLDEGGMILTYNYEYDFLGKRFSVFHAEANIGSGIIHMDGKYTGEDGLRRLRDFAKSLSVLSGSAKTA